MAGVVRTQAGPLHNRDGPCSVPRHTACPCGLFLLSVSPSFARLVYAGDRKQRAAIALLLTVGFTPKP